MQPICALLLVLRCYSAIDVYVTAPALPSDSGVGTLNDPYTSLAYAGSKLADGETYTIHLSRNGRVHTLFDANFLHGVNSSVRIISITCPQVNTSLCVGAQSNPKATIMFRSVNARVRITSKVEIKFENLMLSALEVFVESCSEDWCAHQHFAEGLKCVGGVLNNDGTGSCPGGLLSATGFDLATQYTTYAANLRQSTGLPGSDSEGPYIFGLFAARCSLTFTNTDFKHFRTTAAIIFVVAGDLILKETNFEKVYAYTPDGLYSESPLVSKIPDMKVFGIISGIASSIDGAIDPSCTPLTSKDHFGCYTVTWDGGTVSYINHDIFPSATFKGYKMNNFMHLIRPKWIKVSGVTFTQNIGVNI